MSNPEVDNNIEICVFGANELAVSVAAVIAHKCPSITVNVVDFDTDLIVQWKEEKFNSLEPDLKDLLSKCQNVNLTFVTNITEAILAANIILLMIDSFDSSALTDLEMKVNEKAAQLTENILEQSKIIVQKRSNSPFKAIKILKIFWNSNALKNVKFQVLSMPEFFSSVSPVSHLLNPEFVFIGHEESTEGEQAAATLMAIYANWVPKERIRKMNETTTTLSEITINALLAEKSIAIGAFAAICEESKEDISEIMKVLQNSKTDDQSLGFSLSDLNLHKSISKLIHLCQKNKLDETKDYWVNVLSQNDYQQGRFKSKIFSTFSGSLTDKKFAIFGLSSKGNGKLTGELPAVNLGARMLEKGALLFLYDPNIKMEKETIVEVLKECGAKNAEDRVTLFEDPYKAAENVHGIIFCTHSKDFESLDFTLLYENMVKPAYVFDGSKILNHDSLREIGFQIKTIGRD